MTVYCFEALTAFLDSVSEKFGIPACDLLVYKDGQEVYRHMAGFADADRQRKNTKKHAVVPSSDAIPESEAETR